MASPYEMWELVDIGDQLVPVVLNKWHSYLGLGKTKESYTLRNMIVAAWGWLERHDERDSEVNPKYRFKQMSVENRAITLSRTIAKIIWYCGYIESSFYLDGRITVLYREARLEGFMNE